VRRCTLLPGLQHWRNATSYVALTRHRENVTLFVATETASDLGRLARQMARVDDCRAASQFHAQENPEPGALVDLVARRAQVEEAAACRRSLCHSPMPRSRPIPDLPASSQERRASR
jgi:hypothetical protein